MPSPLNKPRSEDDDAPDIAGASDPRVTGLLAFHQKRKQDSRNRLLAAATAQFGARGYLAVSVEDIATAAAVSRVTFYRHFTGKEALAVELFLRIAAAAMPRFLRIGALDYRDRATVRTWMDGLFEADRETAPYCSFSRRPRWRGASSSGTATPISPTTYARWANTSRLRAGSRAPRASTSLD